MKIHYRIENILMIVGMLMTTLGMIQLGGRVTETRRSTFVRIVQMVQKASSPRVGETQHAALSR